MAAPKHTVTVITIQSKFQSALAWSREIRKRTSDSGDRGERG